MIRVLHAIDTTGPGGAETVFVNLAKGLDPEKFQSFAAITGQGWVCDELRKSGIEPIFLKSRGRFNFKYLLGLVRIIRKYKIEIIQSHLLGSNLYCSLAGMICRVPVISTFHGFVDSSGKDRFLSVKIGIVNLGSRKIIFVSDRLKEHFVRKNGILRTKTFTIYNGVDTLSFQPQKDDSLRKELGLTVDHVLIGAIGNIRPPKGYKHFLKSAKIVRNKYPHCHFIVAGEASGALYEDLLKLRKDLDLEKSFSFLGFRGDISRILNNLDIFVLPSLSEGFSISTIEAMACGIPVLVTRSGGPEEIVQDGISGLLAEPGNEIALAKAILMQLENRTLKEKMANNGLLMIREKFSNSAMLNQYCNLYLSEL